MRVVVRLLAALTALICASVAHAQGFSLQGSAVVLGAPITGGATPGQCLAVGGDGKLAQVVCSAGSSFQSDPTTQHMGFARAPTGFWMDFNEWYTDIPTSGDEGGALMFFHMYGEARHASLNPMGVLDGFYAHLDGNIGTMVSGITLNELYSFRGNATWNPAGHVGQIAGAYNTGRVQGNGSASTAYGSRNAVANESTTGGTITTGIGVFSSVAVTSPQTMPTSMTFRGQTEINSTGGITDAYGAYFNIVGDASLINLYRAVYADSTITAASNHYVLYASSPAHSYHNGAFAIGPSTSSSSSKFYVEDNTISSTTSAGLFNMSGASYTGAVVRMLTTAAAATTFNFWTAEPNGAVVASLRGDGLLLASGVQGTFSMPNAFNTTQYSVLGTSSYVTGTPGALANAIGVGGLVNHGGSAALPSAMGLRSNYTVTSTGHVTTGYGIFVGISSGASLIDAYYGLYLDTSITSGSTHWALYSPTQAHSYHNGSLAVGSTSSSSSAKLYVEDNTASATTSAGQFNMSGASYTGTVLTMVAATAAASTYNFSTMTANAVTQIILRGDGGVLSAGSGGIGYSTGAGGAVTQLTDKTTGVTLNKVSGRVTTANSALASAAKSTFTITNSAVTSTDGAFVWIVGGSGTANAYRVSVAAVTAGSLAVTIENISGGSLSEAPIIGFAIFRAVSSELRGVPANDNNAIIETMAA